MLNDKDIAKAEDAAHDAWHRWFKDNPGVRPPFSKSLLTSRTVAKAAELQALIATADLCETLHDTDAVQLATIIRARIAQAQKTGVDDVEVR